MIDIARINLTNPHHHEETHLCSFGPVGTMKNIIEHFLRVARC